MKRTEKDDAVSPVVGVMLMLVVTIIIAAVVAAFATGLAPSVSTAPFASMTVDVKANETQATDVLLYHNSGDGLPTKDLKLTFAWTGTDGNYYSHSYSAATDGKSAALGDKQTALFIVSNDNDGQFGVETLSAGYYIESMSNYGKTTEAMTEIFGEHYNTIKKSTPVQVTIIHTPSDKIIFNKEVIAA
ncbi:MAG TPA: type IV pilin [Methanocorpusculum sp.]|nr:type IV pilin [Methanocorpusculum sp.]